MCIAIFTKKGKVITKEHLKNCFENNPDGAGMAYIERGKVHIKKGFFNFNDFHSVYKEHAGKTDMLVHCRIATSGGISAGTCHPFPLSKSYKEMRSADTFCESAMVHNGIITKCNPPKDAIYSDTMKFVHDILVDTNYNSIGTQRLIKDYIGYSKIAILSANSPEILIGDWLNVDGIMYSNSTYLPSYAHYSTLANYDYRLKRNKKIVFSQVKSNDELELILSALDEQGIIVADASLNSKGMEVEVDALPIDTDVDGYSWYIKAGYNQYLAGKVDDYYGGIYGEYPACTYGNGKVTTVTATSRKRDAVSAYNGVLQSRANKLKVSVKPVKKLLAKESTTPITEVNTEKTV